MQARAAQTVFHKSTTETQPASASFYDMDFNNQKLKTDSSSSVWLENPITPRELVENCVKRLGGHLGRVCYLDEPNPENIEYATILTAKRSGTQKYFPVLAIYEWQFSPLLYLIDGRNGQTITKLNKLRRCLAMRGDCPYMGVIKNGKMDVYSVALDNKSLLETQIQCNSIKGKEVALFAYLANIRPSASNQSHYIAKTITELLAQSVEKLLKSGDFPHKTDAVATVETAFFERILIDRNLSPVAVNKHVSSKMQLDRIDQIFTWLEENCVGNHLASFEPKYADLSQKSKSILKNIMKKSTAGIENIKWEKKWKCFDFALIPSEIICQVLGLFHNKFYLFQLGEYHVTPPSIAGYLALTAIEAAKKKTNYKKIRILDPAVGTGVMLVATFRQLVLEHWLHTKSPPTMDSLLLIIRKTTYWSRY